MSDEERNILSPLTVKDIQVIDSTSLSSLDKHHVRLLAHCLETFKLISYGSPQDSFPSQEAVFTWLKDRYNFSRNDSFCIALVEQLDVAAIQLAKIAAQNEIAPLQLSLKDLIRFLKESNEIF